MIDRKRTNAARPRPGYRPVARLARMLGVTVLGVAVGFMSSTSVPGAAAAAVVGLARQLPAASCNRPRPFGTAYLTAHWPGGFRGVPVYSNGLSGSFLACLHTTMTPRHHRVIDGFEWQCVELVDRLYLTKGWIESPWKGNGNQLFATAPHFFVKQPQGHITFAQPGDVISFAGPRGTPGHAAIVARVQGHYLTIVNQDTDPQSVLSHAYLRGGRIHMVGWPGWRPIGVVHAP
ncbi:MAG: CHAP domain-containing protein [Acidimicrobiales bacterium]